MRFLHRLARVLARHKLSLLLLVPGAERVYEIAKRVSDIAADLWEEYHRAQEEDALPAEVQEVAQAPPSRSSKRRGPPCRPRPPTCPPRPSRR
jgi:hypothetical protein